MRWTAFVTFFLADLTADWTVEAAIVLVFESDDNSCAISNRAGDHETRLKCSFWKA